MHPIGWTTSNPYIAYGISCTSATLYCLYYSVSCTDASSSSSCNGCPIVHSSLIALGRGTQSEYFNIRGCKCVMYTGGNLIHCCDNCYITANYDTQGINMIYSLCRTCKGCNVCNWVTCFIMNNSQVVLYLAHRDCNNCDMCASRIVMIENRMTMRVCTNDGCVSILRITPTQILTNRSICVCSSLS